MEKKEEGKDYRLFAMASDILIFQRKNPTTDTVKRKRGRKTAVPPSLQKVHHPNGGGGEGKKRKKRGGKKRNGLPIGRSSFTK